MHCKILSRLELGAQWCALSPSNESELACRNWDRGLVCAVKVNPVWHAAPAEGTLRQAGCI